MKPQISRIVRYFDAHETIAPAIITYVYDVNDERELAAEGRVDLTVFGRHQTQTLEKVPCSGYDLKVGHWHWPVLT